MKTNASTWFLESSQEAGEEFDCGELSKNDCQHLTDAQHSPACYWKDSSCQKIPGSKVVAICEEGCPETETPWPQEGSWNMKWKILAPAGERNAAVSTTMQATASCCERKEFPCDGAYCPGLPLVGCFPSASKSKGCCYFDSSSIFTTCEKEAVPNVCDYGQHHEEQLTSEALPAFV